MKKEQILKDLERIRAFLQGIEIAYEGTMTCLEDYERIVDNIETWIARKDD